MLFVNLQNHSICFYNSTVCCWNDSLRKGYVYCKIMYIWRISSFILWIYLWHNLTINCLFFFIKQLFVLTDTCTAPAAPMLLHGPFTKQREKRIILMFSENYRKYLNIYTFIYLFAGWSLGLLWGLELLGQHFKTNKFIRRERQEGIIIFRPAVIKEKIGIMSSLILMLCAWFVIDKAEDFIWATPCTTILTHHIYSQDELNPWHLVCSCADIPAFQRCCALSV